MSAKLCKYGCGAMLIWDNNTRLFKEENGTPHTKDRCESLKQPKSAPSTNFHNEKQEPKSSTNSNNDIAKMHQENIAISKDLALAIRELAAAIRSRPL